MHAGRFVAVGSDQEVLSRKHLPIDLDREPGLRELGQAHFTEPQVVELAAAVALENFRSKFNVALGIEAQGFCVLEQLRPNARC